MAITTYIRKVAIVGAGGHIGTHVTRHLLGTRKHTVTAITRAESRSQFPPDVLRSEVDYNRPETIVKALQDQDCLIITLNFGASPEAQDTLIDAAAVAGVPWILPNEWAPDSMNEGLVKDISSLSDMPRIRDKILRLGKSSYMAITCGLWYEWCLATPVLFGIDCVKKEATLFDQGETKISTSTWPQIGRAVAALLSLPVEASDAEQPEACLNNFKNKTVYISSFNICQRQMLDSVLRVTGDQEAAWNVKTESVKDRFLTGLEARRLGSDGQKGRLVYSRVFFPDDAGNHEKTRGLANDVLNLPKEKLDEATEIAVTMQTQRKL